jgi:hypothetical protein
MSEEIEVLHKYGKDGSVYMTQHLKNGVLHNCNGPAEIGYRRDGSVDTHSYYKEGKWHREDGPAWIWYSKDGSIDVIDFSLENENLGFWEFYERVSEANQKILLRDWIHLLHLEGDT